MLDAEKNRFRITEKAVEAENHNYSLNLNEKKLERKTSRGRLDSSSCRTGVRPGLERASSPSGALFDVDIVLARASSDPVLQKRVSSSRSSSRSKRGGRNTSKSASRRDHMRDARKYSSERGLVRKSSLGSRSKRRGRASSSRALWRDN